MIVVRSNDQNFRCQLSSTREHPDHIADWGLGLLEKYFPASEKARAKAELEAARAKLMSES